MKTREDAREAVREEVDAERFATPVRRPEADEAACRREEDEVFGLDLLLTAIDPRSVQLACLLPRRTHVGSAIALSSGACGALFLPLEKAAAFSRLLFRRNCFRWAAASIVTDMSARAPSVNI